jgi:hypothetical protein
LNYPTKTPAPLDHRPTFYWELPAVERAKLRLDNTITDDEGYLAHDLNWGRRLVSVTDTDYGKDPTPDVPTDWNPPKNQRISDAIAAILQVAVDAGLDPEEVCSDAIRTQSGVRAGAAGPARTRPATME